MSKSKGNVVDPFEVIEKEGADATRWHFYTASNPWLPTRFSLEDVGDTSRRFLGTLWNVYSFYVLYAEIDQFNPLQYADFKPTNIMDKWIISKLNTLVKSVDSKLEKYDITGAGEDIEEFDKRVKEAIDFIIKDSEGLNSIAIVTHGGVHRSIFKNILNINKKIEGIDDVATTILEYNKGKFKIIETRGIKFGENIE